MTAPERVTAPAASGRPDRVLLVSRLVRWRPDWLCASLREYARRTRRGRAVGNNKAFRVNLPNRDSFSPDAAFYVGPDPGMKFFEGAPVFALEVRSESDYGPAAEQALGVHGR